MQRHHHHHPRHPPLPAFPACTCAPLPPPLCHWQADEAAEPQRGGPGGTPSFAAPLGAQFAARQLGLHYLKRYFLLITYRWVGAGAARARALGGRGALWSGGWGGVGRGEAVRVCVCVRPTALLRAGAPRCRVW